jgi:NAD(P)H-flavin reductase
MAAIANAFLPQAVPIVTVTRELADVFTWELSPAPPFAWRPGQFNMLYAPGVGEVPISISGGPLVHTVRVVGAVTRALGKLRAGDTAWVRGPYGTPWPLDEARGRDLLFVCGGLGLAPMRPVIREALARRGEFGRVGIVYGARTPDAILYPREVASWRGRFDVDVRVTVDQAGRDWHGPVGVVTELLASAAPGAHTAAFVCGPEIMMRFVLRALEQRGIPSEQVWVSLERSMRCGVGLCGHCQLGGHFVCKDGPVYRADRVAPLLYVREL